MKKTLLLLAALAVSQPALAKMYKWVDEKGEVHYGDTVPPQYVNQGREELSKKGTVLKKTEGALTPEQRQAREAEEAQKKADQRKEMEQKRRDKALLNTYTSDKEIDLTRDRNLKPLDMQIQTLQDDLKRAKGDTAKAGIQSQIEQKKQEREAVRLRFEADKARFRELTGTAPPLAQPAPVVAPKPVK
jgi:hypothetical protein